MMAASLPPSSRRMRLKSFEQAAMTFLPTAVDPVKTTLRTAGLRVRISPGLGYSWSVPTTTLRTPAGRSGRRSSPMRRVVSGVCGAGFRTTVLPHAKAVDVGFQPKTIGAFHGAITATTPRGLRRTTIRFSSSSLGIGSSCSMSNSLPDASKHAAATIISMRVSVIGRPLSLVCKVANGSKFARSNPAHAASAALLFDCGRAPQDSAARSAAATAASN
mmetsp:Transcript_31318/g.70442  ORF Transcript_31318/g.70442 Transcript_31318/m.70442 type:complete len:218 (-) Transcript_31318:567-1220(-)